MHVVLLVSPAFDTCCYLRERRLIGARCSEPAVIARPRGVPGQTGHPFGGAVVQTYKAPERIGDRLERRKARVETVRGVLEDHLDARTIVVTREVGGGNRADVAALEKNPAVGGIEEPRD